ncbi:Two-component system protein B [Pseudocercospora fuligena]|uniref:histidine kinase n=1 Tax=Pseudocercospora fuligena TaxID=685502 RepID=A0A8H6R7X2_9PEZI|nr:Two-component system protein B [Pseudocercospora fuligena]
MRIPIYLQLASLLLISSLIGLAVISIAVWITTHSFVLDIRASRLSLTASLKAAELASNLDVMQTSAGFVSTRVLIQMALMRYNNGNNTEQNWNESKSDLQAAIGGMASLGQILLLQARVYPKNDTGVNGRYSLLNVTSLTQKYPLPNNYTNGSSVLLGDEGPASNGTGYPTALYPELVYGPADGNDNSQVSFEGQAITTERTLVLGPWPTSDTVSLMSLTLPIADNNNQADILGYLTVVMDAQLILDTVHSREGLMDTGQTLLVSPNSATNRFSGGLSNTSLGTGTEVRYVTPVQNDIGGRHPDNVENTTTTFNSSTFAAINKALDSYGKNESDRSGSALRAKNEAKKAVSVGYAFPNTTLVDWLVLVEQSRAEVWQPITTLRKVILACLFATFGLMVVISIPLARFASTPILRLRDATRRSIDPSQSASRSSLDSMGYLRDGPADETDRVDETVAKKEGFLNPVTRWKLKREQSSQAKREEHRKRVFKIPGKVKERKWWIRDELTDLTSTFNEMSDELMMQYTKLEERVQQRTAELELSKKAAEAANESKTLFIANISHELKTPLNGILGMCAVCMQEEDPLRLKRSLGIIYKSGDLLLNLLTDLLTFSKNQVGQHLSLDEKEFRLRDVQSQALAIFDKQAKDGQIDLRVEFEGILSLADDSPPSDRQSALGPVGTGRMRDMILWGDVHRILQVVINLLSNSLKFTPPGGSVVLTIRALTESPEMSNRSPSIGSRQSRMDSSRHRTSETHTVNSLDRLGTANSINPKGKPSQVSISERNVSPPPGRYIYFEFEVADTGPGIREDLQQKIFEPFEQGDLGLSKKFGGTGLGLSICSQLASLMKGSISLRSTLGLGSTFTLKIPLRHLQTRADSSASSAIERPGIESDSRGNSFDEARASPRASIHGTVELDPAAPSATVGTEQRKAPVTGDLNNSNPRLIGLSQPFFASNQPLESPGSQPAAMDQIEAAAKRGGKIKVLVAEDNKVNQEVVLRMLKLEDIYDVTVAKDGQEALDIVKATMASEGQPFNLIFMDVHMPNLNGIESTKMIREMGYNAPIVALTAYSEEKNVKDCLDSGMNYFLSKPIRRPQLKKVLKEYCAPIPEEPEETPPQEEQRRGSGHSTRIVMVNNHADPAAPPTFVTQELTNGHFENTTDLFSIRNSSSTTNTTGDNVRSVSPRQVA